MKKLSKTTYNKIVKAKILQTGLYNGVNVDAAEVDDRLTDIYRTSNKTIRKAY